MKNPESDTILRLTFDEGRGAKVRDATGNLPDGDIEYCFLHAAYTRDMEPQWRRCGVKGGCLLFDGSSTAVTYPEDALALGGGAMTVSAWIAPRAFEWIAPETTGRSDAPLTGIIAQYDRETARGFLLGFHRFGRLCFQWGDGNAWHALWADKARLHRLVWNHVAAVFDGEASCVTLYLDGAQVGFCDLPSDAEIVPAVGEKLVIGANPHVFTGPSVLVDPVTGRVCMFSIMQDKRSGAEEGAAGWAHCVGLTRNLWLNNDGTDVCVEPDPRLYDLLGEEQASIENVDISAANAALEETDGDMLYIKAVLVPQDCDTFGLTVKSNGKRDETTFTYNVVAETINGYTSNKGSAASAMTIDGKLPSWMANSRWRCSSIARWWKASSIPTNLSASEHTARRNRGRCSFSRTEP